MSCPDIGYPPSRRREDGRAAVLAYLHSRTPIAWTTSAAW